MQERRPQNDNLLGKVTPGFIVGYVSFCGAVFVLSAVLGGLQAAALSLGVTFLLGPVLIHGLLSAWRQGLPAQVRAQAAFYRLVWRTALAHLRRRRG